MKAPKPIVELIGDVVARVSDKLLAQLQTYEPKIQGIYYQYGHAPEIVETLQQLEQDRTNRFKRFPAVFVLQDFPENHTGKATQYYADVNLPSIVIAYPTGVNYKAPQRYEKSFNPVLTPIYEELLRQINFGREFAVQSEKEIPHTKIDRLYWGREPIYKNATNNFGQYLDAIELLNVQLKVNYKQ